MLDLGFSAADLARTRFAVSPVQEVVAGVAVLKGPARYPEHRDWVRAVAPRVAGLRLLLDVVPVGSWYTPCFLNPVPGPDIELADELAELRATPAERVRAELDRLAGVPSPAVRALHDDPATGLARLAEQIEAYWDVALRPHWDRLRALLDADLARRAEGLRRAGVAEVLDGLHPSVRWHGDRLAVAHRWFGGSVRLAGRGLVLVPSVFAGERVATGTLAPGQPTLTFPVAGAAALWAPPPTPAGLDRALGRSRARLLAALAVPASTSELAAHTGLTPGGASQHLTALRAAGLVTTRRAGRSVRHARTPAAEALLDAAVPIRR